MVKVTLKTLAGGKCSLKLAEHRNHIIRIINPDSTPYQKGSKRERAW
jgi:hypothetical protein